MQVINRKAISVMLLIYLALAMHVFIPSMGGSGLRVPGNIVAWVFIALSVLAYWLLNRHQSMITTTTSNLIVIGILLLLLPLFYTSEKWLKEALLQMAGVVAGLIFISPYCNAALALAGASCCLMSCCLRRWCRASSGLFSSLCCLHSQV